MRIVFLGAGNLATRLSVEMQRVGFTLVQVYSRTQANAALLGEKLGCPWTTDIETVVTDADVYVFSLKDAVLPEIISKMQTNKGVWIHTAGSMPIEVFENKVERYGVLYPLQTFSKARCVNFDIVPFFLEANTKEVADLLQNIASALSENIHFLSSQKRKRVHLAAVFACNFTNHMYVLASNLLEKEEISADVLLPLIDETASKVHEMTPHAAQTGPAIRYDENVIGKHLDLLDDPNLKNIYQLLSQNIYKEAHNE